jgi:hypothetical protein
MDFLLQKKITPILIRRRHLKQMTANNLAVQKVKKKQMKVNIGQLYRNSVLGLLKPKPANP